MIHPSEHHIEIVPLADPHGVAIISRHPDAGHPRYCVLAVDDISGAVLSETGVLDPFQDFEAIANDVVSRRDPTSPADVLIGFSSDNYDALLEALRYPSDMRAVVSRNLSAAFRSTFLSRLGDKIDDRAVAALRACNSPSLTDYGFYAGEGERQDRRRQAAASYPLFARTFSSVLSLKMTVDRSKPLAEALVASFSGKVSGSFGKATLRRLASVQEPPHHASLSSVLEFASRISPDWIPSGGPEWRAFCVVATAIVDQLGISVEDTPSLIKGCAGRWCEFRSRLLAAAELPEEADDLSLLRAVSDVRDMVECFANVVITPLASHGHDSDRNVVTPEIRQRALHASSRMLLSGRSLSAALDNSRRWHYHRAAILDATRLVNEEILASKLVGVADGGWPKLTAPVQAPNGLWLVPLDTPEQLAWEGMTGRDPNGAEGLSHCVGGYASKCNTGDCHIVSVRRIEGDGSYTRISTIEFERLPANCDALSIRQNRGHGNNEADVRARDATKWYTDGIASGEIAINRSTISAFLEASIENYDGVERFCGYDWRERDMINAAVAPWAAYVGPEFRRYRLDDLLDSAEVINVRDAFAPALIAELR